MKTENVERLVKVVNSCNGNVSDAAILISKKGKRSLSRQYIDRVLKEHGYRKISRYEK